MSDARGNRPLVVYIAGSGRSGTTLLERMLGAVPGHVNVGELIDLFRRVYVEDERCGCGETFSSCGVWQEVGVRAFGGWTPKVVARMARLQHEVARQRYIPQHLSPLKRTSFRDTSAEYRQECARLYQAISAVCGADAVIDASKWPAQAAALAGPEIDLRVVHLQRDVRGVAWSMGKRQISRPQDSGGSNLMESTGVTNAALRWSAVQSELALLRTTGVPMVRVRYEDLIRDARHQVQRAMETIGLPFQPGDLSHLGPGEVTLAPSHGLSGNPSRFAHGTTQLRLDEAWRSRMPTGHKLVVSAIGLPHLMRRPGHTAASTPPRGTS